MSTVISSIPAALAFVLDMPILRAVQTLATLTLAAALLVLFKPLLSGVARALLLLVRPKRSKEERLARSQMKDAMMLIRMLNKMDGCAPSHAAELRAQASRG